MPITRMLVDIPTDPPRELNFAKAVVTAAGGTFKIQPQADGLLTLISTYPEPAPDLDFPAPTNDAFGWMGIARGEIGTKEAQGGADNPRIVEYHASTSSSGSGSPDSVPWCSSFVNFCIKEAGLEGTNSKRARSWEDWGRGIDQPATGCIVVLWRVSATSGKGHVGFFVGMDGTRLRLLGGNQSDAVTIASFDPERVVGLRLPS